MSQHGRTPMIAARPHTRTVAIVAGAASLVAIASLALTQVETATAATTPAVVDRVMSDPKIVESSALVRSGYSGTMLWTSNDSGGGPVLYAIGANGGTVGTYTVPGASAKDWEAMAAARSGTTRYIYIGDVGDNGKKRANIAVHRVVEPSTIAKTGTLAHTTWVLRYPDGAHNAETMLVNPTTLRLYIVTKDANGGAIYAAPATLSTTATNVLTKVFTGLPVTLSDGAYLDDGRFVLRGYKRAYLYKMMGGTPTMFSMPEAGESIVPGFAARTVFTGEEGVRSKIWRVTLP